MNKRISIVMTLIFLASLSEFCLELARRWYSLSSLIRMDEVFLSGIFLGLILQLWRENSDRRWMLITTTAIAFVLVTHLTHSVMVH